MVARKDGWPKFPSPEARGEMVEKVRLLRQQGLRQCDIAKQLDVHPAFATHYLQPPEKIAARSRAKTERDRILRQEQRVTLDCEVCGDPHNISVEAHQKRLRLGLRQRCRRCASRNAALAEPRDPMAASRFTHKQAKEWARGVLASWSPHERAAFAMSFHVPDDSRTEAAQHRRRNGVRYSPADELERRVLPLGKDMRQPNR